MQREQYKGKKNVERERESRSKLQDLSHLPHSIRANLASFVHPGT
jgi:hypothetical protein